MEERKKSKLNVRSVIVKYLLVFLLFGSLLVLVTVSIQNDLAVTTAKEQAASREAMSLSVLEARLGTADWTLHDGCLYKGERRIGDGDPAHACGDPFTDTENETGTRVYCFVLTSLADERIVAARTPQGGEVTPFLFAAGSGADDGALTFADAFLDRAASEALLADGAYTGDVKAGDGTIHCSCRVIRDRSGTVIGALAAGYPIDETVRKAGISARNASLAVGVIILYTFLALFLFVVKWNRSLKRMEGYLTEIGNGSYPDEPLRISGGDELTEMAGVINEMKLSLEEKERLRNELALARTIQAELLPDADAAGRLPESCLVRGFMAPAREVGGDLYDFFMIDGDRLGLVIADVSDKGAPAALFMATAKMCIKDNMMLGAEPAEVLDRVNDRLLENNRSGLFVTAWIAEADLKTGRMKYACAGHPFPYILRDGSGGYEPLRSDRNTVLAGLPGFDYVQEETELRPGDRLFLYTDGLDEARDVNGGFFGKKRIKAYLDGHAADGIEETVIGMKAAVDEYAAGREQYDDLTMLMFGYAGGTDHE